MNFIIGKMPEKPNFDPKSEGWTPIKTPSIWTTQLLGLTIGLLFSFIIGILWYFLAPLDNFEKEIGFSVFAWMVGVMILHELVHATLHPGYGLSSKSYLGFWPSKLVLFAYYDGFITKKRYLILVIAPFVVISVVPLVFCIAVRHNSSVAFILSIANTMFASIDLLMFFLILFGAPSNSLVQNNGWKTYFKRA